MREGEREERRREGGRERGREGERERGREGERERGREEERERGREGERERGREGERERGREGWKDDHVCVLGRQYLLIIDTYVCRDGADETNQFLVGSNSNSTVPD